MLPKLLSIDPIWDGSAQQTSTVSAGDVEASGDFTSAGDSANSESEQQRRSVHSQV